MPIPKNPLGKNILDVLRVVTLRTDAKTFVVVRAFEMIAFPRTYKFARPGAVPIPTFPEETRDDVFIVNEFVRGTVTFGTLTNPPTYIFPLTVRLLAKIFVVVRAFDMTTFPRTYRFARPGEVPIPRLEVIKSVPVLIEVALMEVANRFVVVRALLA